MLKSFLILVLAISTVGFQSFGQSKRIFSLDTTFLDDLTLINMARIEENNAGDIYITGRLVAWDTANLPHQPQFIFKLPDTASQGDYTFIEEASGFIIFGMFNQGIAFDNLDNIYTTGAVNSNAYLCRNDQDGNIDWTKRQGHHWFSDIKYGNGNIAAIAQDESSSGNHTMLLTVADTSGNLLMSENYYSGHFDDVGKLVVASDGYLIAGMASEGTKNRRGVFLVKTDFSLNHQWTNIFKRNNIYHQVAGVHFDDQTGDFVIAGTASGGGAQDSIFCLKVDDMGNELFYKSYHPLDTFKYTATSLAVSKTGEIFISMNQWSNWHYAPVVLKLDNVGSPIWAKNYESDTTSVETVSGILLNSNEDKLYIVGDYKIQDSVFVQYKNFYVLDVHPDSGRWLCDEDLIFNENTKTTIKSDTSFQEPYLFSYLDYPFISTQDMMLEAEVQCPTPEDTIEDTTSALEDISGHEVSFSNPNQTQITVFGNAQLLNTSSFVIFNKLGQPVKYFPAGSARNRSLAIPELAPGMYFIQVLYGSSSHSLHKIVVID